MKSIKWFKAEVASHLRGYEIEYRYFASGDFGDLDQVEFNSEALGGEVDFWSSGRLAIHLVDYISGNELMNLLWEEGDPDTRRDEYLREFAELLLAKSSAQ